MVPSLGFEQRPQRGSGGVRARAGESVEGREQERRVGSAELRVDHEPGVEAGSGALVQVGVSAEDEEAREGVCEAEPGSSRAEARAISGFPCASAFLNLP